VGGSAEGWWRGGENADLGRCCCKFSEATCAASCNEDSRDMRGCDDEASGQDESAVGGGGGMWLEGAEANAFDRREREDSVISAGWIGDRDDVSAAADADADANAGR
jgi:hypothetical protein